MTRIPLETSVLSEIRPTESDRSHLAGVARMLVEAVNESGRAGGMVVGSVARNTFIRGDKDLDIFLLFDPDLPREVLEDEGLTLARRIAERFGTSFREKYAEHPYINASIDGLDVDLVPCYRVADAGAIRSAVDRTPFHTRYVIDRIDGWTDDVLLAKQFAKGGGVYGSDQMTGGFSGYLCELLVLYYRGFRPLLSAASEWRPGTLIDPESHAGKTFSDPLVVIDPVDPCRNVSASVSLSRMFEFVELARGYLEQPDRFFFFPPEEAPFSRDDFIGEILARKTAVYAILLPTPPYIEDIVVPQLRKSADAISSLLGRNGFTVVQAAACMNEDQSMLFFEILTDELPPVKSHDGPPLWSGQNARKFFDKYLDKEKNRLFSGPFIRDGRYVVELPREYRTARMLLGSEEVLGTGLGKHVKLSLAPGWVLLSGGECWRAEFSGFLKNALKKSSPLVRIRRALSPHRQPGQK
ncbi:MAG: CCA tRNA nucleotidyltransferase [Methanoregulaceae archaeon]|nr:CCA tRNA nucleotidyltransferase [Methanoregulaceae archaeon]